MKNFLCLYIFFKKIIFLMILILKTVPIHSRDFLRVLVTSWCSGVVLSTAMWMNTKSCRSISYLEGTLEGSCRQCFKWECGGIFRGIIITKWFGYPTVWLFRYVLSTESVTEDNPLFFTSNSVVKENYRRCISIIRFCNNVGVETWFRKSKTFWSGSSIQTSRMMRAMTHNEIKINGLVWNVNTVHYFSK